jgi:hypothetical protein
MVRARRHHRSARVVSTLLAGTGSQRKIVTIKSGEAASVLTELQRRDSVLNFARCHSLQRPAALSASDSKVHARER